MFILEQKGKIIEKYLVNFDEEEVKKLRVEVINNCSEIIHRKYDSTYIPNQFDLKIRKFTKRKIGIVEGRDYDPDRTLYHFDYLEYDYPYLVTLIDKLLKGNKYTINEIFNPDMTKEKVPLTKRIDLLNKEIIQMDNSNIDKKIERLKDLADLIKAVELNNKQEPVDNYYLKLQSLLYIEHIDTILIEDVTKVENFFEITVLKENEYTKGVKKTLKKD